MKSNSIPDTTQQTQHKTPNQLETLDFHILFEKIISNSREQSSSKLALNIGQAKQAIDGHHNFLSKIVCFTLIKNS